MGSINLKESIKASSHFVFFNKIYQAHETEQVTEWPRARVMTGYDSVGESWRE
jgi:hypothetical protein